MSHEPGTYLGGIRTVECLRQRSRIDPETGCWHWGLALSNGVPVLHMLTPDDGRKVKLRGRRAALYLQRGNDLRPGQVAFARVCCNSDDCVNPDHSRSGNRVAFGKWLSKSGKLKGIQPPQIGRGRKLTDEQVREIRESTESVKRMAKRLGVAPFAVWSARRGFSYANVGGGMRAASVFDWRGSVAMNSDREAA